VEVVGVAANGQIALTKVEQYAPDLVTMDIEMPVMNGIEAVRALRAAGHRMPIIMFSTLTERGAVATLDALSAGASDYVTKPTQMASMQAALADVAAQLVPKIKALVPRRAGFAAPAGASPRGGGPATGPAGAPGSRPARPAGALASTAFSAPARTAASVQLRRRPDGAARPVRAVVLGSSTGGPEALSRLFRGLTVPLPVPLVIVQHMPPVFTTQLAARLDRLGPTTVVEATDGLDLVPGTAYIAPGDQHLELVRSAAGARTRLTHGAPVNFCRPAVDVMFRSAVEAFGGDLLAVVLTGMGSDGKAAAEGVVAAGGTVMVQDEATSVVWGMPGAVATAGLAHVMLPMDEIAGAVMRAVSREPGSRDTASRETAGRPTALRGAP
jgi:two-component system chemotaxis response regulator CheB